MGRRGELHQTSEFVKALLVRGLIPSSAIKSGLTIRPCLTAWLSLLVAKGGSGLLLPSTIPWVGCCTLPNRSLSSSASGTGQDTLFFFHILIAVFFVFFFRFFTMIVILGIEVRIIFKVIVVILVMVVPWNLQNSLSLTSKNYKCKKKNL